MTINDNDRCDSNPLIEPHPNNSIDPPTTNQDFLLSQDMNAPLTNHVSPLDTVLFFASGIGASLCQTSILSSLVHYACIYGDNSNLYINLATFSPLLPLSIAQALFDNRYDNKYGSMTAFSCRGIIGYAGNITVVALWVPFVTSQAGLCLACLCVGFCAAVLFGTMNQMASFVSAGGELKASFSFGFQASGIITLGVSLATGFGRKESDEGIVLFYEIIAGLEFLCLLSFLKLVCYQPAVQKSMRRRDSLGDMSLGARSSTTTSDLMAAESDLLPILSVDLSYKELWHRTWPFCACVAVTVATSMTMGAWFTKIHTENEVLPQTLFFVRLFSDTLGRPTTLLFDISSLSTLAWMTIIRLFVVPIFFVLASADAWCPIHTDAALVILVAILSFSSGFIVTVCYQLAPGVLLRNEEASLTKQASLINISFSVAAVGGVLISVILLLAGL